MSSDASEQIRCLIDRLSASLRTVMRGLSAPQRITRTISALGRAGILVISTVRAREVTTQTLSDGTEQNHVTVTLDVTYRAPDGSCLATTAIGQAQGDVQDATLDAVDSAHWIALSTTLRVTNLDLEGCAV